MSSSLIIPLLLAAMAVFMFVNIRNQKKRAAATADMQSSIVAGTRVQLHCGLFGIVADTSDSDVVHIEIAPGVVTEWNRLAIREAAPIASDEPESLDDADFQVPDSLEGLDGAGDGPDLRKADPESATDESDDDKREEK